MTLRYTTTDAIARRLIGRLEVIESVSSHQPWGGAIAGKKADPQTYEQVALQKEAEVNAILRQVYEFPLQLIEEDTKHILSEIVEKLTVAELLDIYYQGSSIPAPGSEVSGLASSDRLQAYQKLYMYVAGHGIQIPQIPAAASPQGMGMKELQPVFLPGEKPTAKVPDTLTRSYTLIGQWTPDDRLRRAFDEEKRHRAPGAQRPGQSMF